MQQVFFYSFFFFFFQAEDGIRDATVTGVQTCALPISARPDAGRIAGLHECFPDRRRLVRWDVELVADLTGIAGPRHDPVHAAHVRFHALPGLKRIGCTGHDRAQDFRRARPLQRDLGQLVALVVEAHVPLRRLLEQPGDDLVAVRGVDAQEEPRVSQPVHEDVVLDPTGGVAHHRVVGVDHGQLGGVCGRDRLETGHRAAARDRHPAHVTHVEQPDGRPDGLVLLEHAAVLDWHLPAGEVHQLAACQTVLLDQRSALHGRTLAEAPRRWKARSLNSRVRLGYGGPAMPMTYRELLRLANAFSESQTLLAANDLDVFTAIGASGRPADAVARRCKADPEGMFVLLNALVGLEL